MPFSGCLRLSFCSSVAELLAIPGGVERFDGGAEDRNAGFLQPARKIQRRLPAELDDHAFDEARDSWLASRNGPPFSRSQMFRISSCVSGSKNSRSLVS